MRSGQLLKLVVCAAEFRTEDRYLSGNKSGICGSFSCIRPWHVGVGEQCCCGAWKWATCEDKCRLAFLHSETWKCSEETDVGDDWNFSDSSLVLHHQSSYVITTCKNTGQYML